jgi:hypothetical protein
MMILLTCFPYFRKDVYPFYNRDVVAFPFCVTLWGCLSTRIVKASTADATEEWIKALPTAV